MLPHIWCHLMVCVCSGQQLQADQQRERERQTSCLVRPEDHAYAECSVPNLVAVNEIPELPAQETMCIY